MISVITTTHNDKDKLHHLYYSLKKQTFKNFEWIIADDGSDDGTWDAIRGYAKSKKVKIDAFAQLNKGMRLARNINNALRRAEGRIVFVVFADTYLEPNTLELVHRFYDDDSFGCGLRRNVNQDKTFHSWDWRIRDDSRMIGLVLDIEKYTHPYTMMCGNSMIAGRKSLEKIGYWPEEYEGYGKEDWCTYLRLYRLGLKPKLYNNIIVNHFWHGHSSPDSENNTKLFDKELKQ